jgi:(2Fe-2S) ferredoxin
LDDTLTKDNVVIQEKPMPISLMICIKDRGTVHASCGGGGSDSLADAIEAEIKKRKLPVEVDRMRCLGECERGPNMRIAPGGRFFYGVNQTTISVILDELEAVVKHNLPS